MLSRKIIVINEMYSDNIGDQAISDAMELYCCKDSKVAVDKEDFSFRTSYVREHKISPPKIWKSYIPKFFKKIIFLIKNIKKTHAISKRKYDVAIIGGGQLILGNATFSASMLLYAFFLKLYGTKIKIVSVGVGEKFSLIDSFLYKLAFLFIDDIYLRDSRSIENLKNKFKTQAQYSPDIAYFLFKEKLTIESNGFLVCPVEYNVYNKYWKEMKNIELSYSCYEKEWVSIINNLLVEDPDRKIIITATTIADYIFSLNVSKLLNDKDINRVQLIKIDSWTDFVSIAKECKGVISGRMHALILCHNLGMEIRTYKISLKIDAFENEYLNSCAYLHKKNLDGLRDEII